MKVYVFQVTPMFKSTFVMFVAKVDGGWCFDTNTYSIGKVFIPDRVPVTPIGNQETLKRLEEAQHTGELGAMFILNDGGEK